MTSIRASIYERDATTLIAHLPRLQDPKFLEELNGDGSGEFQLHLDDPLLVTYPHLLDGDNVVKMRITNAPDMDPVGWIIETATPTRTAEGGRVERTWTVTGRGMRARPLSGGVIYPETGLRRTSADTRAFDFSSRVGPWKVLADWVTPEAVRWDLTTSHRANLPTDWPDTNAYWLWSTDPDADADQGRNYFRHVINLASGANVAFFVAADNVFSLRIDGEEVMASDFVDPYAWQKMFRYDATLAAGDHTIAAWVHNTGAANPAGFILTATTLDADGVPDTLVTRTNPTDWQVHGYAPPIPGWHTSLILSTLVQECLDRDEMGGAPVTFGFSDTVDSDGVAWTDDDLQELHLDIGADLLSVLPQLQEAGLDVAMAHDFTLNAWRKRGTDLSGTLRLAPGRDVQTNTPDVRYGPIVNSALIRHGTGWVVVEDSASITAHGKRAGALTIGDTDSENQAIKAAGKFFEENATAQVTLTFTISSASPGPKPYKDFNNGDILLVPGVDGAWVRARCMSITPSQPSAGLVQYEVTFYPED